MKRLFCLGFALFCTSAAICAPLSQQVRKEIDHLLSHLEKSDCEFQRNGSWHSGSKAKQHLRRKYDYLANKGLMETTEDFIRLGASQSSTSGKPYQVRCPGKNTMPSALWLEQELQQFRQQRNGE